MRGVEQNQNQTKSNDLPRSRALGIITLMFALLLFQVGVFLYEKVFKGKRHDSGQITDDPSVACQTAAWPPVVGPSATGQPAAGPTAAWRRPELFYFDPNTVGPDSLCLLGFSQKQAESIVKYRSKGGKFRKKSDFAKMYVVSEEKYRELEPYIVIPKKGEPQSAPLEPKSQSARPQPQPQPRNAQPRNAQPRNAQPLNAQPLKPPKQPQPLKPQIAQPLLIDINTADSASFTGLYGIGGYYARKIIEYRERLGNFYSTRQLMEIPGIDSIRFEGFARNITADPAAVKRFSLDTASKSFLIKHPYVGAYAARGILLMRAKFGVKACNIENLVKERIISPSMAEKLWFYIENF